MLQLRPGLRAALTGDAGPQGIPTRELVAHWRLGTANDSDWIDPGTYQQVADLSGHDNTLQRGSTSGTDTNDFTPADYYSSFTANDYGVSTLLPAITQTVVVVFQHNASIASAVLTGARAGTTTRSSLSWASGKLSGQLGTDTETTIVESTTLVNSAWYMGILKWDGASVKLKLGTSLKYSGAQHGIPNITYPYWVGAMNSGGTILFPTTGLIAEVLVYARQTTDADDSRLYRTLKAQYAAKGITI